jgi:hypothetical protein
VIDTSPDPEWSGGNGYWKSISAQIVAIDVTADYASERVPEGRPAGVCCGFAERTAFSESRYKVGKRKFAGSIITDQTILHFGKQGWSAKAHR